jgi:hypothetical protein
MGVAKSKEETMTIKRYSLAIIALVVILTGCPDPTGSDNNGKNGTPKKLTVGYLSNLMVDIGDATALGISKRTASASENARATSSTQEKNYLVKTTVDYSHGNVEWDENGLTNVTFKKRTTETVVIPVYDEEGNLIGEEEVEDGQTVTQEEIPAQVNKLYVHNNYTFIQFVPDETDAIPDIRPGDLGGQDKNGYYEYDKCNYYNDDYHQSFVIENSTGNIYSVENSFHIDTIHNGLLRVNGQLSTVWDLRINSNAELEIFSLRSTSAMDVMDYYKDKHGNNFIWNGNGFNETDFETNTIYFSTPKYYASLSGEVIYLRPESAGYDSYIINNNTPRLTYFTDAVVPVNWYTQIQIVGLNCTYRNVTENDDLVFNGYEGFLGPVPDRWNNIECFSHIKNKKFYVFRKDQGKMLVYDTDTVTASVVVDCDIDTGGGPILYDTFIFSRYNATNSNNVDLYYYKFDWDSLSANNDFQITQYTNGIGYSLKDSYTPPAHTLLFDNVLNNNTWPWRKNTLADGLVEYTVAFKEDNGIKIPYGVKVSEYVPEEYVIILKPINR